ncbi:3'(2'),5'-bisphosphate nucleotidase CysQ [Rhizobium halophilum]|uniref:3'(2'),5'-bisphosphate nucleotidase CysQ n=1 Tax=Rhizobium halophilum TaxID=2846852 RepID=UPI001EFDDA93|nr:3'(2'),5'-bisphosphate nucleotidase CysQ [Rhizobium halophilum]MCF6370060.1 3'(2'),5'-bisphosphate nucleotidase CysQ [Rhizobium halophilum]
MSDADLLEAFQTAALLAGRAILDFYQQKPAVAEKADHSPVTEADERAERIILEHLWKIAPDLPVIAEEEVARGNIPQIGARFVLVDALDGTREFIAQRSEFTVNIALIQNGIPTLGFVYAPAQAVAYCGSGAGAKRLHVDADFRVVAQHAICVRKMPLSPLALSSRSHESCQTIDYLQRNGITQVRRLGSSLKFCLVAEGAADLYPRFGRTMEWDTAAGDAVLRAAGGFVKTLEGAALTYGKTARVGQDDFVNPDFIASGG